MKEFTQNSPVKFIWFGNVRPSATQGPKQLAQSLIGTDRKIFFYCEDDKKLDFQMEFNEYSNIEVVSINDVLHKLISDEESGFTKEYVERINTILGFFKQHNLLNFSKELLLPILQYHKEGYYFDTTIKTSSYDSHVFLPDLDCIALSYVPEVKSVDVWGMYSPVEKDQEFKKLMHATIINYEQFIAKINNLTLFNEITLDSSNPKLNARLLRAFAGDLILKPLIDATKIDKMEYIRIFPGYAGVMTIDIEGVDETLGIYKVYGSTSWAQKFIDYINEFYSAHEGTMEFYTMKVETFLDLVKNNSESLKRDFSYKRFYDLANLFVITGESGSILDHLSSSLKDSQQIVLDCTGRFSSVLNILLTEPKHIDIFKYLIEHQEQDFNRDDGGEVRVSIINLSKKFKDCLQSVSYFYTSPNINLCNSILQGLDTLENPSVKDIIFVLNECLMKYPLAFNDPLTPYILIVATNLELEIKTNESNHILGFDSKTNPLENNIFLNPSL